jgi:hypothetical protein
MRNRRIVYMISSLGLSFIFIFLLSSSIENIALKPAKVYELSTTLNAWFVVFSIIFFTSIFLLLVFRPKIKRNINPPKKQSLLSIILQVIIWLLLLYILRKRLPMQNRLQQVLNPNFSSLNGNTSALPLKAFISYTPEWLLYVLSATLTFGMVIVIWYFYLKYKQSISARKGVEAEATAALEKIRSGVELTNIIIKCYSNMCRHLEQEKGIRRHDAMTSREFERRLIKLGFPEMPINQLTQLFENVRYGNLSDTQSDKNIAISCMQAIISTNIQLKTGG